MIKVFEQYFPLIMPVEPGQAPYSQTIVIAEPQAEPAGQMVIPVTLTPPEEQIEKPERA